MPRRTSIGFMPAATALAPSRTRARARIVAVVVPSPAVFSVWVAASQTSRAPTFWSRSSSSISLATVTPSLVIPPLAPARLIEHGAALRAESHRHDVGEDVDTLEKALAGVLRLVDLLLGHRRSLRIRSLPKQVPSYSITPMMSDSFMINSSSPSTLTSVPDHLPNKMRLPALTSRGLNLPSSPRDPRPCRDDLAFLGLLLSGIGNDDAARRLLILLDPPHQHAVVQRPDLHAALPRCKHVR